MNHLGFLPDTLENMRNLISHSHGLILVSGPTGSGKTTTLYSALTNLNKPETKIITIEDPIEYDVHGIQQIQVKPDIGLTFAAGLRSVLRHDPDIILVGEIRDSETAKIAIQSALTGHFVFSTLHTNDSAGSIVRLIDMGVENFLIASSIIGVLSQRLVRVICPECKYEYVPETKVIDKIRQKSEAGKIINNFYKGKGCSFCKNTGYRGRTGIFELMLVNDNIRKAVMRNSSSDEIKKIAVNNGMQTLFDYGLEKVSLGVTTISEVLRVCTI
jgi:type II secretory ATPase GspE/PulE/Tfp pilus assembly ATPase PilB-like protein